MKVGILTFHRAHNYGAVLQCYALQQVISEMGHDVEVIDYRQPQIEADYKAFSLKKIHSFKQLIKNIKNYPRFHKIVKERKKIFQLFINNNLKLSQKCKKRQEIPTTYDVIIIGSDQLWSKDCMIGNFDMIYFGDFNHDNTKIIGYAISSNRKSLDEICKKYIEKISNFNMLSLRDEFVLNKIQPFTKMKLHLCIDPTLLTKSNTWDNIVNDTFKERSFIVLYQVQSRKGRSILLNYAINLAKKTGCEVIDLTMLNYSVENFVSIIKYSKCVITSSFHACAFAIIFKRPLYAFKIGDGRDDRYINLLESLGMNNCLMELNQIPENIPTDNCQNIKRNLELYRKQSLDFLQQSLNKFNLT